MQLFCMGELTLINFFQGNYLAFICQADRTFFCRCFEV